MLMYALAFAMVAIVFNMANRNLAKRGNPKRKTRKQALEGWKEFEKKYPPKSKTTK